MLILATLGMISQWQTEVLTVVYGKKMPFLVEKVVPENLPSEKGNLKLKKRK